MIEGWESKLADYLDQAHRLTFQWGSTDCALWVGQWVKIATGNAWVDEYLGRYKTEKGAALTIRKRKCKDVAGIMALYLKEVPVSMARRGDILLHPENNVGICNGRLGHFLMVDGYTTTSSLECRKAWRVG